MSKIFLIIALSTIFTLPSIAKTWTNYAGLALNVPISQTTAKDVETDEETKISQMGAGAELTYIGIHHTGFLLKANAALGAITSDDIEVQGSGRNVGIYENLSLGAGFAFINSESFLFGAAIIGGAEISEYTHNYSKNTGDANGKHQFTERVGFVTPSVGGSLFFAHNITSHFGFYADIGARYIFVGDGQSELRDEWTEDSVKKSQSFQNNLTMRGKYIFTPSIGLIWHF